VNGISRDAPDPPFVRARGISKAYGAVRALDGVSVDFHAGEVHGLVGANGAGKSTLLKVLGGAVRPDAGAIDVAGAPVVIATPRAARERGFSFIHQELSVVPRFSAVDNMTLGMPSRSAFGLRESRRRRAAAQHAARRLGLRCDLERPVSELSVAERGLVAIGRALIGEARLVSMDEPTAALSDAECEQLFGLVAELTAAGVAVVYVSHRLDEIERLCDRVTVFKEGRVVDRRARGAYDRDDLVRVIAGEAGETRHAVAGADVSARAVLEVRNLRRGPRVADVSFALHAGEVLGLAGLVGSGRTEVARLIFGADRIEAGSMELDGRPFAPRSPVQAIAAGVALVPEERRSQALVLEESIAFNATLGSWAAARPFRRLPFVSDARVRRRTEEIRDRVGIAMRSPMARVRTLSGGNQQKVVIGRWTARDCSVLLLDEPTRGVDVGARAEIYRTIAELARQGKGVLVVSSELEELEICDRVVVLVEGRSVAELHGPGVSEASMLRVIFETSREQEAPA
jgi:ribose transport system ATP-binding protein